VAIVRAARLGRLRNGSRRYPKPRKQPDLQQPPHTQYRDQRQRTSMSALFSVSIEESPDTLTGTLPNGVRQRCRRGLTTKTDGFPQTVDQPRTTRTFLAMPFNGIARRRLELSVQVP
jgi:hypothetical protein